MIFGIQLNNPKFYVYNSTDTDIVEVIQMSRTIAHVVSVQESIIEKTSVFTYKKLREHIGSYFNATMNVFGRDAYATVTDYSRAQVLSEESDLNKALRLYAYCKAGNVIRFVPATDLETMAHQNNTVEYYRVYVEPKSVRSFGTSKSDVMQFDIIGYELLADTYPFKRFSFFDAYAVEGDGTVYGTVSTFPIGNFFAVEWWHQSWGDVASGGSDTIIYNSNNGGNYIQSTNTAVNIVEKTTGASQVSKTHNGRQMGRREHFVVNRNYQTVECFQNGASLGTGALSDGTQPNYVTTVPNNDIHGAFGFTRIYRRPLTLAEVKRQWNNGNGAPPARIPMFAGWDFSASSGLTVPDISGEGKTVTWVGTPIIKHKWISEIHEKYCAKLDGNSQYATVNAGAFSIGAQHTIEIWTRAQSVGDATMNRVIISGNTGGISHVGFNVGSIFYQSSGGTGLYFAHGLFNSPTADGWNQWILRRISGQIEILKNGVSIGAAQTVSPDNSFYVAQLFKHATNAEYYKGLIRWIRIYPFYTDNACVARMWNGGKGQQPLTVKPYAVWEFDGGGAPTSESDLGYYGKTLTLLNSIPRVLSNY